MLTLFNSEHRIGRWILVGTLACLSACGGTKILKEPVPLETVEPLAAVSHDGLEATLDWVIVRDGPGTWARNADWDQYLLRIANGSELAIVVEDIYVIDSLGARIDDDSSRKRLVKASRKTAKRYKGSGIEVKAGAGTGTLVVAGTAAAAAGYGAAYGAAQAAMLSGGSGVGGAAVAASGLVLLGPTLVVAGVIRGANNHEVAEEIEARHTPLPLILQPTTDDALTVFFPLAPSPREVVLVYTADGVQKKLSIDTSVVLTGLHLDDRASDAAGNEVSDPPSAHRRRAGFHGR